jgi:prepilin-type N-terminal cleavage/methylation domain-containing protein
MKRWHKPSGQRSAFSGQLSESSRAPAKRGGPIFGTKSALHSPRRLSGQVVQRSRRPLTASPALRGADYRLLATGQKGFTLFELLASIGILAILSALLFAAFNQASKAWLQSESRVETFTQARAALDLMSRELSQAIVTTNIPFLANTNNLAFIAPVSDRTSDAVDLAEVVYRLSQKSANATPDSTGVFTDTTVPFGLVRRIAVFSASATYSPAVQDCWDYGRNQSCNPLLPPWDFYDFAIPLARDWPETGSPNRTAVVAENVIAVRFYFQDMQGHLYNYWNSIDEYHNTSVSWPPWQNEIANGIPYRASPDALYMTNRAPAAVIITIAMVDSRAAARLRTVTPGSTAWRNIVRESRRQFTTSVSIPNRQP